MASHASMQSAGRQSRHSQINGIHTAYTPHIHRAFLSADVLATREPTGLCTMHWSDWKTSRRSNNRALEERTMPGMDTFAISHIQGEARQPHFGRVLISAPTTANHPSFPQLGRCSRSCTRTHTHAYRLLQRSPRFLSALSD